MKTFLLFSLILTNIILQATSLSEDEDLQEIIDPTIIPKKDDPDYEYITIFHTNDIHGSFYPKKIQLPSGKLYTIGGLEYIGKYISTLKQEWGDHLLYLDSGDHFQGGIEGYISQGKIIMDYFNKMNLNNSAIGNHDFDYGMDFLKNYMNYSNFDWLAANILNTTQMEYETFPNQKKSILYKIGDIKIGIIGLTTQETTSSSLIKMEDLSFQDYETIIKEQSKLLKENGANAIIVLGHLGLNCNNEDEFSKLKLDLRNKNTSQGECSSKEEAVILLNKLTSNDIDLFLAGHKHEVVHHWINDIPIVSNARNGQYADIIYLPFDKKTKKLVKDLIKIESPLPICEKIFSNKQRCNLFAMDEDDEEEFGELVNYKFHGVKIEKNENVEKIGEEYKPIFDKYDKDLLTFTNDHFDSSRNHENNLGNFYSDFLRHISGADISITTVGGFRTPLYRGNITNATIHSFDPFGNKLVMFKAYGYEIKHIFSDLQSGKKAFYPFSGLKMSVKASNNQLVDIKIYNGNEELELRKNVLYTIVSIDFCFPIEGNGKGGDDFSSVYSWFRPREAQYLFEGKVNSRDAFIEYLRNIDELKESKYYNKNNQRLRIIDDLPK